MTCKPISGSGFTGFMCSRGPRRAAAPEKKRYCVACLRLGKRTPAFHLCDFPTDVVTCDKAMCDEHRRAIRPGVDWCRDHDGVAAMP